MRGIESWIGLDVGKADHHATVLDAAGEVVFDRPLRNAELALERLLEDAGTAAALVTDQPGRSARWRSRSRGAAGCRWPMCRGRVMRRASELYPGEAKTDRRDSFVIADTARIHQARVHWLSQGEQLPVLGGHDEDLAHDYTRAVNRLRDLLLQACAAVERVLGPRMEHLSRRCCCAIRCRRRCVVPAVGGC